MKKVLGPDMVAHTFAHQLQDEARNSNSSLFFVRDKIYSYGYHFCIAKHVVNPVTGEKSLLFTTRGYSNTTARHIRIVENGTNHIHKIYCPYPDNTFGDNMNKFKDYIKNELSGLSKARKPEKYIIPAERIYDQCVKYCNFFSTEVPNDITELINSAKTGEYVEYLIKEAERIEQTKKLAEQARIKKYKADLTKWRSGKLDRLWGRINEDYLRIKNNRINTSQNVDIPIELGKKLFGYLINYQVCKPELKSKLTEKINNFKLLHYTISELNDTGIRVGCHFLTFKEINKLAKTLNWI